MQTRLLAALPMWLYEWAFKYVPYKWRRAWVIPGRQYCGIYSYSMNDALDDAALGKKLMEQAHLEARYILGHSRATFVHLPPFPSMDQLAKLGFVGWKGTAK